MVTPNDGRRDAGEQPAPDSIDRAILYQRTLDSLRAVWESYAERVPASRDDWRSGAAYVRESTAISMARESPITQLKWVLDAFVRRQIWAPWNAIYFEAESATTVEGRPEFQQLVERALGGDFELIGAKSSDRLFRSMSHAQEIGDDLYRAGVEIVCEDMVETDPRNPHSWQSEMNQRQANEFWSRRTSEKVGKELERLSADGRPLGRLPEGYRVALREAPFQGMQGKILAYEANEPFASVIVQGKDRYLAGATFAELAIWSADTECAGRTPRGSVMNWHWWHTTLLNPKYAGHHMPSTYMGYSKDKRTKKRPRRKNGATPLVPCMLPALWSLDDFERIVEVSKARQVASKNRKGYRLSLLSSIAYDERCGHRMGVHSRNGDIVRMACGTIDATGRHSGGMRTDPAEADLDHLIGGLSFDDAALLATVEQELVKLASSAPDVPAVRPDPEVAGLQAALAAVGESAPEEIRMPIVKRLQSLRERDEARRLGRLELVRRYRVAISDLRHWADIWATAGVKAKNELLKTAGLRVYLGREEGSHDPAEIRWLEVNDPIFGLALAAVCTGRGLQRRGGLGPRNPAHLVRLPEEFAPLLEARPGLEEAA